MSEQHTDPNAEYNVEVRRIAEVLAKWRYIKDFVLWEELSEVLGKQWDECEKIDKREKEMCITSKMEEARAMVAEMDKVFILGALGSNKLEEADHFIQDAVNAERIKRGLIPATE